MIVSDEQAKGLGHTYTCIHSPPNSLPSKLPHRLTDLEKELMVPGVGEAGGDLGESLGRKFGMDVCTLLYLKCMTNKALL